ncbi:uncharacterized protein KY384_008413 [Bacidia gigantensis]|uniref:uncharacterized protein n=1 Tax=Bacidia gigantensis TaxID=2732470 RepID=UPI001D049BA9|nr:uncharacterized protein KY384_008413 [Bacidia gigantensis]KAG8526984.1 hypothetical protein KY384_008413 [Bacidia gigantensis]
MVLASEEASSLNSLDAADYDPINHLNAIFSQPSTLSSVSRVSLALDTYQNDLDREIAAAVKHQTNADAEAVKRIQDAESDLPELFEKVENVSRRAMETEEAITDMTADIKRLDNTKRNLTLSMTALKRLQMLTTAYEQLKGLSSSRQYRECAQLLQAVIQLMAHFKSYRSIDQIATLSRNVSDLQRELLEQVCEDFEVTFAKGEIGQKRWSLAEACQVMEALGENARSRLITWYCNTQLREYRQLFRGSEEAGSLENISMRYSWFKRLLKTYDSEHAPLFPQSWRVSEILANAFCEGTREDFKGILSRLARRPDGQTMDVELLLKCLQETLEFEQFLEKRFFNASRTSMDTVSSSDDKTAIFNHAISEAFEPHLNIWVEAQDKQLSMLIPRYKQQPLRPPEEEFSPETVLASSTDLFNFYRLTLSQCARLSPGAKLLELSKVFAKYLDQYAQQILWYHLSERPSGQTPSKIPNVEDMIVVLNTADYCYNTSVQLDERIKARIDAEFRSSVDLQSQGEAFMGIAAATVRALVRKVELELEPSWREMRNTGWSKMENVTDQSSYISEAIRVVNMRAGEILALLHKQQYTRAFCDNVVDMMLLDIYTLKKYFEALPMLNSNVKQASTGYIKRVGHSMARIDPILKTLQVRPSPPEALVQAYLIHIADKSDSNFRKIIELKGLKKQDQSHLTELFQAHRSSPKHENLQQSSPVLTPLSLGTSTSSHLSTGIGSLGQAASLSTSNLPGRFDPTNFGNAIMTAARDGVDRFGTPALSSSTSGTPAESRIASPPPPANRRALSPDSQANLSTGNLNENLRNIGKFFKRDIGFGGRFGRSDEG